MQNPQPPTTLARQAALRPRLWVEIDLEALVHNFQALKKRVPGTFISVIKKDAYGHGAVRCARVLGAAGADYFAVATVEEALELRQAGIEKPILVFGVPDETEAAEAIAADLTLTVTDVANVRAIGRVAEKIGKTTKVHLKVDTGMTRVGWPAEEQSEVLRAIENAASIELEGVYSHLADSENDAERSRAQAKRLETFVRTLEHFPAIVQPPIVHLANSAGTLIAECAFTGARIGIALYGGSEFFPETKPVMTACSRLVQVRDVPVGSEIGYGATFRAERPMKIGIVSAGYGDGILRSLAENGLVSIRGIRASIIGRICMDQFMVDLTGIKDACAGDSVLLFGTDSNASIPVYEIAGAANTISYELLTLIGRMSRDRRWIEKTSSD